MPDDNTQNPTVPATDTTAQPAMGDTTMTTGTDMGAGATTQTPPPAYQEPTVTGQAPAGGVEPMPKADEPEEPAGGAGTPTVPPTVPPTV